jgi:hypothetical protein
MAYMSDASRGCKGFLRASFSRHTPVVATGVRTIEVVHSDVNDVVADVVAIPIGCLLSPVRRVARALFERSPAAAAHLARLAASEREGLLPTSVVIFPQGTHGKGGRVAVAAMHDDRPDSDVTSIEPDATRIRVSALRIFDACEQSRAASLAIAPLGGIDMEAHDAVAIAADALVEYWRTHPTSAIQRVVFFERTPERTLAIVDVVRARFPGATVRSTDDDDTTIFSMPSVGQASAPASGENATAIVDVNPSLSANPSAGTRPPLVVPPPEPPRAIVAPFGLGLGNKHTTRLAFERWQGACGGSPIPAGCTGVAFRFARPPSTVNVIIRVHASALKNAWLDGKPLADGRAHLSVGDHVLALECGAGLFAALVEGTWGRSNTLAKVRAVADGAVSSATTASGSWTELAGGGPSFTPVTTPLPVAITASNTATPGVPAWFDREGVILPEGTRFVRFVFPIVFEAQP